MAKVEICEWANIIVLVLVSVREFEGIQRNRRTATHCNICEQKTRLAGGLLFKIVSTVSVLQVLLWAIFELCWKLSKRPSRVVGLRGTMLKLGGWRCRVCGRSWRLLAG